jgi:hypothetical protein
VKLNEQSPIWWNPAFLKAQDQQISFLDSNVRLPFVASQKHVGVGTIGPYSGVFPIGASDWNLGVIERAWRQLLEENQTKNITVRIPPRSHFSALWQLNKTSLETIGFKLMYSDTNQTIDLTQDTPNFNRNRTRLLVRAQSFGMTFESGEIVESHRLISSNRESRGFPLSMTSKSIEILSNSVPGIIKSYVVCYQDRTVASSIVFTVSQDLAYVFMWGHEPKEPESGAAMALMAFGLFDVYKKRGFSKMCLGTSSVNGQLNPGLYQFKASLGAYSEARDTYEWKWPE